VVAHEHANQSAKISQSFGRVAKPKPAPVTGFGPPVVAAQPANTQVFGNMYVPRFGPTYAVPMAGGTTTEGTLDNIGIGHYNNTQMPGQVGNFAVAGHRTTHGAPFNQIANLQVGDKIYLETKDGFYTYTFRNLEYVPATQVSVLSQSPDQVGVTTKDRVMTMTSCNPMYTARERIVAFSVFDSWQPRSAGAPSAIAAEVKG
jgi:sortase A